MTPTGPVSDIAQAELIESLSAIAGREHCLSDPAELFV